MNEAAYEVITKEDLQGAFRDALEGELAGVTAQLDTLITAYSLISPSTIVISAADSKDKNRADYICDGTADEEEINDAIVALAAGGGRILLLEGTFYIAAPIVITKDNVVIEGQGASTILLTSLSVYKEYRTIYVDNHDHIELKNFQVAFKRAEDEAICLNGCDYARISGLYSSGTEGAVIEMHTCTKSRLTECSLEGDGVGIYLLTSSKLIVSNNFINYPGGASVLLESSSNYNIVESNVVVGDINVYGASCTKNLIHGNMTEYAIADTGTSTTIADNVVY